MLSLVPYYKYMYIALEKKMIVLVPLPALLIYCMSLCSVVRVMLIEMTCVFKV